MEVFVFSFFYCFLAWGASAFILGIIAKQSDKHTFIGSALIAVAMLFLTGIIPDLVRARFNAPEGYRASLFCYYQASRKFDREYAIQSCGVDPSRVP